MIKPTVGRSLLYTDPEQSSRALCAQIAYVHSDTCINIGYLTVNGEHRSATSVPLVQEGETPPRGAYAHGMPYQQQVAKGEIEPTRHATDPSPASTVPQS